MFRIENALVVIATALLLTLAFGTPDTGRVSREYETIHQTAARYGVDLKSRQCERLLSLIKEPKL